MSVVERERTSTTVVLNPTPEQAVLALMIEDVQNGKWCRDLNDNGRGGHCTYGLLNRRIKSDEDRSRVSRILDRAIPLGALNGPRGEGGRLVNGGHSRGSSGTTARVCSFNNTAEGPEEIIAWYERAMVLEG